MLRGIKNIRMGAKANQLRREFEELWDSPAAYRPEVTFRTEPHERMPAMQAINALSDFCAQFGATAGDVGVLSVEFLREIDRLQDYRAATDAVMARFDNGTLKAVVGRPMRNFLSREAAAHVLGAAGGEGRPEAFEIFARDL